MEAEPGAPGKVSLCQESNLPTVERDCLVWSKNASSLEVSEKHKYFNADELIGGKGLGRMEIKSSSPSKKK